MRCRWLWILLVKGFFGIMLIIVLVVFLLYSIEVGLWIMLMCLIIYGLLGKFIVFMLVYRCVLLNSCIIDVWLLNLCVERLVLLFFGVLMKLMLGLWVMVVWMLGLLCW